MECCLFLYLLDIVWRKDKEVLPQFLKAVEVTLESECISFTIILPDFLFFVCLWFLKSF